MSKEIHEIQDINILLVQGKIKSWVAQEKIFAIRKKYASELARTIQNEPENIIHNAE